MGKGGGYRGNRGGRGGNGGNRDGARAKGNAQRQSVRYPSDHPRRREPQQGGGDFTLRFPSDSNLKDPVAYTSPTEQANQKDRQERGNAQFERRDDGGRGKGGRHGGRDGGRDGGRGQGSHSARGGRDQQSRRGEGRTGGGPNGRGRSSGGRRGGGSHGGQERNQPLMKLEAFELFCSYYLGITVDDAYRHAGADEVARRFGVTTAAMKEALRKFELDETSMKNSGFDLSMARMDIKVSPPGVSKKELARGLFEEFQEVARATAARMAVKDDDFEDDEDFFADDPAFQTESDGLPSSDEAASSAGD